MLTRWDPFSEMNRLHNELIRSTREQPSFAPAIDIREDDDAFRLVAELPGMKADDVHVDIDKNTLTLSGEKRTKSEEENESYRRIESSFGKFTRAFTLPSHIDAESISAEMEDGLLELTLPKKAPESARKIAVAKKA